MFEVAENIEYWRQLNPLGQPCGSTKDRLVNYKKPSIQSFSRLLTSAPQMADSSGQSLWTGGSAQEALVSAAKH